MQSRPILFSAPMIRALLAGTKTQTRRIVKHQPPADIGLPIQVGMYAPTCVDRHGEEYPGNDIFGAYSECGEWGIKCPYGHPGDRLWVRETFGVDLWSDVGGIVYRATTGIDEVDARLKWRSPIHMPRSESRILLEITAIRCERLQDISTADALAEGVNVHPDHHDKPLSHICSPMRAYRDVWESIHGPDSWAANPWVWVIEFRRITP